MAGGSSSGTVAVALTVAVLFTIKLGLALLLLAGNANVYLYGDGQEYVILAETLYRTGQYQRGIAPEIFRLPGYSWFLLPFQPVSESSRYAVVSIVQLALTHLWLLGLAQWMRARFGAASAVVFVVLLSLTITWIHYPPTIHSDVQFAILVFSGLVLVLEDSLRPTRSWPLLAGSALCWAGATLTRPDLAVFPLWMAAGLVVSVAVNRRRRGGSSILLAGQAVTLLAVLATILLWATRNLAVAGRFTYTAVLDFAVNMFLRGRPGEIAAESDRTGLALLDIVLGMTRHLQTLLVEAVPALIKIFVNPGRWYLHRYLEALGIEVATSATAFAEVGWRGLPPIELLYIAFNVGVSLLILALFAAFVWRWATGRFSAPLGWVGLTLWVLLYFVAQKAAWGALDPGSGPRYGMSIYPMIVFLGALTVARPAWQDGDDHSRAR